MPTYEYVCDGCGHRFDAYHSITADSLKKCPACGKRSLQRLIGTSPISRKSSSVGIVQAWSTVNVAAGLTVADNQQT